MSRAVALIAVLTGAAVALAGGGEAYWLCVPAVMLAASLVHTRIGAAIASASVMLAGAMPALASLHPGAPPPLLLAVVVPGLSTAVLVAMRERLERDRDALREFALRDPLTGIANRRMLLARADYEVARHARTGRSFALVMLDLDGFKLVNDRFGHPAGDDLLCEVADALRRAIRAQDTAARIGGDEFCVLAPETDDAGTEALAERISSAVDYSATGVERLRASIGIALFPDDGADPSTLLHAADQRLIAAKRERRRDRSYRRAA